MKLILLFFLLIQSAFCLEIDEKMTLRIVKTSQSKKTVLINRGVEDGLVKGDHAKFFLSTGVVARGVCIKTSPTRSVWSIYRLVNSNFLKNDQVMKLKITAPVKVTKDESRALVSDDPITLNTNDPRSLGIPLAEGADDIKEQSPLQGTTGKISVSPVSQNVSLLNKNKEVFLALTYAGFSEEITPDTTYSKVSSDSTNYTFKGGVEIYFKEQNKWYSRFSLLGLLAITSYSASGYEGAFVSEYTNEFGFGLNWYPSVMPHKTNKIISFLNFTTYIGSTTSEVKPSRLSQDDSDLNGSTIALSGAYGVKYFTTMGLGASASLEYYSRTNAYAESDGVNWTKTSAGPRINASLLYRF